jgi:myo-inositol 2-dehydrogenase/D-chiro-inositol 1-dehydrogenase
MITVGVIGCGIMGADHAALLHGGVSGARLVALQDADGARSQTLSARLGNPRVIATAEALIADPEVQAVLIASPDATHAPLALAAIAAGKPVLCEKPLAATLEECHAVVAAEIAGGRRLVQVGFMRRFDPGYRAQRQAVQSGEMGRAMFLHCVHRNKVGPDYVTSDLVISNSAVHELDIARFVLGEDYAAVTVIGGPASRHATHRQPQFVILETTSGVVVTIEMSPDAMYGYDVQGELVCEDGTLSLAATPPVSRRQAGHDGIAVEEDWRGRFQDAYRLQLQEWVAAIRDNTHAAGSSAWDGYVAAHTAEAALEALRAGGRRAITLEARPGFYDDKL